MTKKKSINPIFFYNEKKEPILVRFSVKDFNSFYAKLEKLAIAAKKQSSGKKVLK